MDRRNFISAASAVTAAAATVGAISVANAQEAPEANLTATGVKSSSNSTGVWKHEDVALIVIDYQDEMFAVMRSTTPNDVIELNTRYLMKAAKAFEIPVILSTVGVNMGINSPTKTTIAAEMPDLTVIDRSTMNAWEDKAFLDAVVATGKKRLVFVGLFTEICLAFPVISALQDGYDVMFVEDAVGGESPNIHQVAVTRMVQAGAVPNTSIAMVTEFFRDWSTPQGQLGRDLMFGWYLPELQKLIS